MVFENFDNLFEFPPKSKIKAGEGLENGEFPFFTSSPVLSKRINKVQHNKEALIFGTGGNASVHFSSVPFSTSTDCIVAIKKANYIDSKFVFFFLLTNISILEKGFKGAGLKHISKDYIKNIRIPILPLHTQLHIAKILSQAEGLIAQRRESIRLLDEYLKSVFLEMFGDTVTNPKKWRLLKLSDFGKSRLGKMLDGKKIIGNNLKPYLRNSNVLWFSFKLDDLLEMDFDEKDRIEFSLRYGDILMCEGGEIGRCAIWRNEIDECYFQKAIHRIRLDGVKVLPEYFVYMFWVYSLNGGMNKYMGAATISHLTGEKLKKMELPVPPLPLQTQFAQIVEKTEALKAQYQQSLQELENLYGSLSQRAFRGELNPKDGEVKYLEGLDSGVAAEPKGSYKR